MRLEFGGLLDVLRVLRVLLEGLHPDDDGLVHLVADDGAGARLAHGALRRCLLIGHALSLVAAAFPRRGFGDAGSGVVAGSPVRSFRKISGMICARSWRPGRIWRWVCHLPVASWKRRLNSSCREAVRFLRR